MSKTYQIFPGIGIARLGNSPEAFYIGPEAPGIVPDADGSYRDKDDLLKRQGARFRIYEREIDECGGTKVVREVTANEAKITWSVHLLNSKAAGPQFPPANDRLRNADTADRNSLIINAGRHNIEGVSQAGPDMEGSFKDLRVKLGNLRTDPKGRLIVLGGHGVSSSSPTTAIGDFANNRNWHDDVSDGPVRATVQFSGAEPVEAEPSWVVAASPAYAPSIDNMMTWFDQAQNVSAQNFHPLEMARQPSFTKDIYPVLKRAVLLQWTSPTARGGHSAGGGDFLQPELLAKLADNIASSAMVRQRVLGRIMEPGTAAAAPNRLPTSTKNMPLLFSGVNPQSPLNYAFASLTDLQYGQLERWADGDFIADWPGQPPDPIPFDQIPLAEQPAALDQAALQACIGGPFFPGIETGFVMARAGTYEAAFRVDRNNEPGHLTQGMALPWQADFLACGQLWWPAQRPVNVKRDGSFQAYTPPDWRYSDMVREWWKLGFILKEGDEYTEQQRVLGVDEAEEEVIT